MRTLACILIVLGIYLTGWAIHDELRGRTSKPWVYIQWPTRNRPYLQQIQILRNYNPQLYRQYMIVHWIYALTVSGVGGILLIKIRQRDRPA